jgi:hypothetical protein
MHMHPNFDKEFFFGKDGSYLRQNISMYDFKYHSMWKSSFAQLDGYLCSNDGTALLLFYGDITAARAGWLKTIDAWQKIEDLVQSGERSWNEYAFEGLWMVQCFYAGMMAANEMGMLRELARHTWMGVAHRDALAAAEFEAALREFPYAKWEGPDGHCLWRAETRLLYVRALAAVVDQGEMDLDDLRSWLPPPSKLIHMAQYES